MLHVPESAREVPPTSRERPGWGCGWRGLEEGLERWRQRRLLRAADDRMLKDLGISRCDTAREAAKRWRP